MTTDTLAKLAADFVPRLLAVVTIYQQQATHGMAVDAELFGAVSRLVAAQALPAAEPFGYFKAEPFGWTDCAETDEGAIALYEGPQQAAQPEFIPIAKRKLHELQDQGYLINGYSLIHKEKLARGLIDSYGFVGWWSNRDHERAATPKAALVAEFGERMAGYGEGFDDGKGVGERQAAQATAGWREQHDRDSAELRSLCQARDEARRERDLGRVEIAGLESSVGHLSALVDHQTNLLTQAMQVMKTLHASATPDDSNEAMDAIIPGADFAKFVDDHARLMYLTANSPVAALPQPQPQSAQAKGDAA